MKGGDGGSLACNLTALSPHHVTPLPSHPTTPYHPPPPPTPTPSPPQPVEEWRKVPYFKGNINALEVFYKDQHRYAYLFQNHVFMTRWNLVQETAGFTESVRCVGM